MKKIALKQLFFLMSIAIMASAVLVSCEKDDEDDDPPVFVEDGLYVAGPATGFDELTLGTMMQPGREEGDEFASLLRDGMFETFLYLGAGNFNVTEVAGATRTEYGWDADGAQTLSYAGEGDDIIGDVIYGGYLADGNAFNITQAGFYHLVFDKQSGMVFFTKIDFWGAIGDATDLGWSGEFQMDPVSVSQTEGSWQATGVALRERGGIKFRYNQGWKIASDMMDFVIFANIGQGDDADSFLMGGGTFAHPEEEGEYTITLNWDISDGWSFAYERTGDVDPLPEYPEAMYMIGDGVGGWSWDDVDLPMIPVWGKPHLFWKIVWMEASGGFKFAPQKDWIGDFGVSGAPDNGIFDIGGDNAPVPGVAGYYMVVVNLHEDHNKVAVVDPIVNLFGDVADWTSQPFTVDNENEVITITHDMDAGTLRLYAWFDAATGWFEDWWQSEFIILNDEIVFRGTGDDQERVNLPAGVHKIDLNFRNNTGTITAQ